MVIFMSFWSFMRMSFWLLVVRIILFPIEISFMNKSWVIFIIMDLELFHCGRRLHWGFAISGRGGRIVHCLDSFECLNLFQSLRIWFFFDGSGSLVVND